MRSTGEMDVVDTHGGPGNCTAADSMLSKEDKGPIYIKEVLEGLDSDGESEDGHLDLSWVTVIDDEGE